jgi:3',5'-cyclic AMP phosphodiesterase CpdA
MHARFPLTVMALVITIACSNDRVVTGPTPVAVTGSAAESAPAPTSPPTGTPPPAAPSAGQTVSVTAVGDTGMCSERDAVQRTADLAARFSGPLLLLGDLAYDRGTYSEFMSCFDPAWGRFRGRWHPAPGNHEYLTAGAAGYLEYFASAATPQGRTFYSQRIGEWLVLMLDSNERAHPGSAQYEFVRSELSANRTTCTLAAWHHPLFSSGPNGANPYMRDLAALLTEHGAELFLAGHDHLYERSARQRADGRADTRGARHFVVGTGGARLYQAARRETNSELVVSSTGVLRLTLHPASYDWAFIDSAGTTLDMGSDQCR